MQKRAIVYLPYGYKMIAYFTGADNMSSEGMDAVTSASVKEVDGELVGNTEYVAGKIQENTLNSDRLDEIIEEYLQGYDVKQEKGAGL